MVQPIPSVVPSDHFDLFKFADCLRDIHVGLFGLEPEHRFFQKIVYPVPDNQGNEFNKDLRGKRS